MGLFKNMKDMQAQAQGAMATQGAPAGMAGMGDMGTQAAYAQLAQKLHASGVEAPGVVHSITPTGQTDMGGGQQTEFDVSIRPADGDPFQTTISQSMLPAQLEGIAEGAAITVKYDPDSPTSALIYGW
jgi:NAD(P)H-dependent FMN reductase